ncbi:hypothetical protein N018_11465 [Pseudomonas syringae CC1557]|uniref:Uncharacterized protein n=1 Tax=Pseudomonas syringae CC1557 TaxID=1357279 RepID=W0MYQ4_PSESX|nr:hypothetical protein N018_11465 [Pseudomonas syringae CC1557]
MQAQGSDRHRITPPGCSENSQAFQSARFEAGLLAHGGMSLIIEDPGDMHSSRLPAAAVAVQ